ncbi:MAG: DUF3429 domain-containing protein [Alphaproteobacteria bacterium]|nr:DUF3429 domain-containing protein [Alphaproteobacteria bacterium]
MNKFPLILTLIGVLPFVVLSIAVSGQMFDDNIFVVRTLLSYSTLILSFLGGIHWGVAVSNYSHDKRVANLLILESVLPSTLAWGVLLHADIHIQLLVLTVLFTFIWAIDSVLVGRKIIPLWFFEIRCIITPIVVVSLYVAYFSII